MLLRLKEEKKSQNQGESELKAPKTVAQTPQVPGEMVEMALEQERSDGEEFGARSAHIAAVLSQKPSCGKVLPILSAAIQMPSKCFHGQNLTPLFEKITLVLVYRGVSFEKAKVSAITDNEAIFQKTILTQD